MGQENLQTIPFEKVLIISFCIQIMGAFIFYFKSVRHIQAFKKEKRYKLVAISLLWPLVFLVGSGDSIDHSDW